MIDAYFGGPSEHMDGSMHNALVKLERLGMTNPSNAIKLKTILRVHRVWRCPMMMTSNWDIAVSTHSRQSPGKTPPNLAFGFTMDEKFK